MVRCIRIAGLDAKHISAAAVVAGCGALRVAAQVLAVPILSRLLIPYEYGQVAVDLPILLFALVLTDAGVGVRPRLLRQKVYLLPQFTE